MPSSSLFSSFSSSIFLLRTFSVSILTGSMLSCWTNSACPERNQISQIFSLIIARKTAGVFMKTLQNPTAVKHNTSLDCIHSSWWVRISRLGLFHHSTRFLQETFSYAHRTLSACKSQTLLFVSYWFVMTIKKLLKISLFKEYQTPLQEQVA